MWSLIKNLFVEPTFRRHCRILADYHNVIKVYGLESAQDRDFIHKHSEEPDLAKLLNGLKLKKLGRPNHLSNILP